MTEKKRKSVYDPEACRRWRESNRERSNYQSARSAAKTFIRKATLEDLEVLEQMIEEFKAKRIEEQKNDPK